MREIMPRVQAIVVRDGRVLMVKHLVSCGHCRSEDQPIQGEIMITTLIFDLDGLLADTEGLHRRAYQDVLGGLGITVTDEQVFSAVFWVGAFSK